MMTHRVFDTMFGKILCFLESSVDSVEALRLMRETGSRFAQPVSGNIETASAGLVEELFAEQLASIREAKLAAGMSTSPSKGDFFKLRNRPDGYYYNIKEIGVFGPFGSDSARSLHIASRPDRRPATFKFYMLADNYLMSGSDFEKLQAMAKRNRN